MKPSLSKTLLLAAALLAVLLLRDETHAETTDKPFLHALFTNSAVLQRDLPVPIWGWTTPGAKVTVSMEGKSATAVADKEGKWLAKLGPFKAGGPFELTVTGPQSVTLKDILVGEVWICSGQSNMEQGIGVSGNAQEEIAKANYPQIRLFTVPKKAAMAPTSTVDSKWLVCTPANIANGGWGGFTAVGYYFGRHLHQELKVPIGLIHTSWGGTVAEAWTSSDALKAMPDFKPAAEQMEAIANNNKTPDDIGKMMTEWWAKNDPGSANGLAWAQPSFEPKEWKTMQLPTAWETAGLPNFDGVVWFRKEFDLPESWNGRNLMLHLGPIDDRDTTFVNGVQVGACDVFNELRNYKLTANLLKPGRNVIAVRVLDTGGNGGIYGQADQMKLEANELPPLSLSGAWLYNDSVPLAKMSPIPQPINNNPNTVTVLYNGMIAPLLPYGIKGAIWYQGESNANRPKQYQTLLPTMITDWRARFGVGDFPFFIVSLANFMAPAAEPTESDWAALREAQWLTTQKIPKTGVAMAIDIGEANDIHPKNKQDVGKRLALNALAIAYEKKIEFSGPVYRSMKIEGNKIRLSFDHMGGGLVAKGDKLTGFAVAGEDKKFVWADAVIDGDTIVLSSPKVEKPLAARYAWANNPVCNLYNKADLPAVPFRTDGQSAP